MLLDSGIIACLAMIAIILSWFCPDCCLEAHSKRHAHILIVLQLGCRTLNRGTLHTVLPPALMEVPQLLDPCLVLRRNCAFLISCGLFLPQARLLKELEHKMTRESLHRQQLDLLKTSSMERLLEDVKQKEQHLQLLAEEAERAARRGQLQRKKTERELRQVTPGRGSNTWKAGQAATAEPCHSSRLFHASQAPQGSASPPSSLLGPPRKWKYVCPPWAMDCSSCLCER